jgi:uncharacterized FlgJ-related protein
LINLIAEVEDILKLHIDQTRKIVFTGLSKTIQNELLDSILAVTQDLIQKEIAANETTDNANITLMDIDRNKKVLGTIDPSVPSLPIWSRAATASLCICKRYASVR